MMQRENSGRAWVAGTAAAVAVLIGVAGCTSNPAVSATSGGVAASSVVPSSDSSGQASSSATSSAPPSSGPVDPSQVISASPTSSGRSSTTTDGSKSAGTGTSRPAATTTAGQASPTKTSSPGAPATPTSSPGAPATTPVPAPGGGNIDETVASVPETTAAAVPLTKVAEFGGKVSAKITGVKAITAKAQGPGEITGPAVAVTLQVTNGSKKALEVDRVTVNLADSQGNPGSPMSSDPASPFSGSIEPGGRATGTYVFSVGADLRSPITLSMSYTTEAPVVLFVGDAP